MTVLMLLAGLVLLAVGGDALVRGAVAVARRFAISPLVIGLTLVGFGTSMPELVTSVHATLSGAPDIAVGNVVGSNIANILLILGLAALLAPIACDRRAFRRDGPVLAVSQLLAAGLMLTGTIGRPAGLLLVAGILGYTLYSYLSERRAADEPARLHAEEADFVQPRQMPVWLALALTVGGIAATVLGARLLVDAAVELARLAGIPETVIGLTLVAVGTSLPELATAVAAALRGQADVAFGNVIGSNIFNALGILGAAALVSPLAIPAQVLAFDLWVMLAVMGLTLWVVMTGWRITRGEGALLLGLYVAYVAVLGVWFS
ncbi:MAG: calcium/sodium antiporter [Alphaproteobacteria bacterium]|jgi:cation:H+ antiporter|nr:calcium/sodium antiporter [Alphaproteobacteria bacterium]